MRTVATTLAAAARRVVAPDMNFRAAIQVDGENMDLAVEDGRVEMRYAACPDPDLVFSAGYADLLAVTEGEMSPEDFVRDHSQLDVKTAGTDGQFMTLMSGIIALLND